MQGKERVFIVKNSGLNFDTLIYDLFGRLIYQTKTNTHLGYDSNNYLIHYYFELDGISNNTIIKNKLIGDTLIQEHVRLNHSNWKLNDADFQSLKPFLRFYNIISSNSLRKSFSRSGHSTEFYYDKKNRLTKAEHWYNNNYSHTQVYEYFEKSKLFSQVELEGKDTIQIKIYNNGVLERLLRNDSVYTYEEIDFTPSLILNH